MNAEQRLLLLGGVYINAALYLAACFIAGLVTGNGFAWRCAIVAMGVSYIGYGAQVWSAPLWFSGGVVGLSVVVALLAGIALL